MKRTFILACLLAAVCLSKAQVGINTSSPAATLDVVAKTSGTTAGTPEGLISPRLTLSDLNLKSSAYTAAQTGTLVYVTNASNAAPSGKTINITAIGYYYFDGTLWQKMSGNASSDNIYSTNGTLQANRTVAMGDKTLGFTSGTPAVNQFNIDGTLFSADTQNDRIGIGTSTPQKTQHVNGSLQITNELNVGGDAATAGSAGTAGQILSSGGPGAAPVWINAPVANSTNIYNADGTLTGNRTVTQGENALAFTGNTVNSFSVDGTTLSVDAANNRVGIGTAAPNRALEVNAASAPVRVTTLPAVSSTVPSSSTAPLVMDASTGDIYQGRASELVFTSDDFINNAAPINVTAVGGTSTTGAASAFLFNRTFTLLRPAIISIFYNTTSSFRNSSGQYISDSSFYVAQTFLNLTNTTTNTVVKGYFAFGTSSYTNGVTSTMVLNGFTANTSSAILDLPAGTYRLDVVGGGACSSGRNVRVTFGEGPDQLYIKADYK
ncbi:hypothetical protein F3J23_05795 [Chryseobacterium sp. Tr-659]|uniref:hypothetical protein n=1 Tax=Chryseobacterium sp. Tr-659 TaxID=2608340 RepID=UPI001421CC27|nr:hypothetical protein [Chryseobacterium sp. Tr-659]NIF04949.1 hypothetical protein [Chryseobacterium sp. Tr-659]